MGREHPTGQQGDAYLVGSELYVWDQGLNNWKSVGDLQGPAGPREIQFSSAGTPRFQTGATGERVKVTAIGLGSYEVNDSYLDPINIAQPAISIKTNLGGTVTDISVALSISLGSADLTGATIYVQLYSARPYNAREFFPVPNTLMSFTIPMYAPIGSTFTTGLTGLSARIDPGTQLVLGFYCTSTNVTWGINAYLSGVVNMQ